MFTIQLANWYTVKNSQVAADKYFQVDLGGRAAGTYTVNLGYDDSNRNVNVQVVKY